jgi:pectinesterase
MNSLFRNIAAASFAAVFAWPELSSAETPPTEPAVKWVKADGSGDFKSVQEAINAIPQHNTNPVLIKVAPGAYPGRILVPRGCDFITLQGAGKQRSDVVLTGGADKVAVLKVCANDFRAENFTVENTAGQVGPQQALYGDGKRQVFENLLIKGWQDTLGCWNGQLAYFHKCEIWGSVDFIYSGGTAVFNDCNIVQIRETGGVYAAPSTPKGVTYGLVFLNCRLVRAPGVPASSTTLDRPWFPDGATAFINCWMDDHVSAKGWSEWDGREKTARAAEYGSKRLDGTIIDLSRRAPWVKILTAQEAVHYTVTNVLGGWAPQSNPESGRIVGQRGQLDSGG